MRGNTGFHFPAESVIMTAKEAVEAATDAEYLADLGQRLLQVPVMYGTDQGDTDRLAEIAKRLAGESKC